VGSGNNEEKISRAGTARSQQSSMSARTEHHTHRSQQSARLLKVPRGSEWVALALYQDMVANDEKLRKAQAHVDHQKSLADALHTQILGDEERRRQEREEELSIVDRLKSDFEKYKEDIAKEIQARHEKHSKQRLIWQEQVSGTDCLCSIVIV
jgi:hypothetical protein